ncbi:hypothetical protein AB0877_12165 [Micromonospora sp. NPDC047644]|uniref:hypothetical protein n=1 Tax=Micromonospora sp. NPDC047644 TaxID=3157203 RepID=UPI0034561032
MNEPEPTFPASLANGLQVGIDDLDRPVPSVRAAGLPPTYSTPDELHSLGRGVQLAVYRIVQSHADRPEPCRVGNGLDQVVSSS